MTLSSFSDITDFFKTFTPPVVGVGVYPYNRLGLETLLPHFTILSLARTAETELIEEHANVVCISDSDPEYVLTNPKNSHSVVSHHSSATLLKQIVDEGGVAYTYKITPDIEEFLKAAGVTIAGRSADVGTKLEDKITFRDIINTIGLQSYKTEYTSFNDLSYEPLREVYGEKFVLQYTNSGGGHGTFFITDKQSFESSLVKLKAYIEKKEGSFSEKEIMVAEFVEGESSSISGIATRWGTATGTLQRQLVDVEDLYNKELKRGDGFFCGHDWTASEFDESLRQQAEHLCKSFGDYIYKEYGFRGYFGMDVIVNKEKGKVYPIECNARLTGALPTHDLIQIADNQTPFIALHLLEFLPNVDIELDIESITKELTRTKRGAHMFILSELEHEKYLLDLNPGVYSIQNDALQFIRSGFHVRDIQSDSEFLVTEIPTKARPVDPNSRLSRIVTRTAISQSYNTLNNFGKDIVTQVKKHVVPVTETHESE